MQILFKGFPNECNVLSSLRNEVLERRSSRGWETEWEKNAKPLISEASYNKLCKFGYESWSFSWGSSIPFSSINFYCIVYLPYVDWLYHRLISMLSQKWLFSFKALLTYFIGTWGFHCLVMQAPKFNIFLEVCPRNLFLYLSMRKSRFYCLSHNLLAKYVR